MKNPEGTQPQQQDQPARQHFTPLHPPANIFPPEGWDAYFLALGRFFHMFATMEDTLAAEILNFTTNSFQPLPPNGYQLLRAVINPGRLAPSIDLLKRLARVSKLDQKKLGELSAVLAHLAEIQYLRDKVAHSNPGPSLTEDGWWFTVSNTTTAREFDNFEGVSFTIEHLEAAAGDLERIPFVLGAITFPGDSSVKKSNPEVFRPWSYRPSSLRKTGPRHDRTPRSPGRPP